MAIGKRLRFEIFKRDGFTCQYCGRRPPEVVLEVDHIHPRAAGGGHDELNLITSCGDCNRGKGDKVLREVIVRPDADMKYMEAAQEVAEAKRFLETNEELWRLRGEVVDALQDHWRIVVKMSGFPAGRIIIQWLAVYSGEEIREAITLAAAAFERDTRRFGPNNFDYCLKYVSGVLRNRSNQDG